nr:MAG TPA: hypothetical protein [Caudoviricetes sp.]
MLGSFGTEFLFKITIKGTLKDTYGTIRTHDSLRTPMERNYSLR